MEPAFSDFEFNTVGPDCVAFAFVYEDARKTVPAVRLSSTMLSYLGLVVLVSTPNRPSDLMIEEPENGLTAQATKAFFGAVCNLAFRDGADGRQMLISTHIQFYSPRLVILKGQKLVGRRSASQSQSPMACAILLFSLSVVYYDGHTRESGTSRETAGKGGGL